MHVIHKLTKWLKLFLEYIEPKLGVAVRNLKFIASFNIQKIPKLNFPWTVKIVVNQPLMSLTDEWMMNMNEKKVMTRTLRSYHSIYTHIKKIRWFKIRQKL